MHQSFILVAWINDGRPSLLLLLRLTDLVVIGEGIWRCSRCNSAMDFFLVVKLPRLHDGQLLRVFSFRYRSMALCTSLRDSSPLVSVSFCDLGVELYTQDLVKFLRRRLFQLQDIFFKMAGSGRSTSFGWRSFIHCFVERRSKDYVCLFTATELKSCIASFETTGNLATCTLLRWLWICCCVSLCLLYWTRYYTDLEQMLKKQRQNIRQNEHWMLETSCKVGLKPEGAHCHLETIIIKLNSSVLKLRKTTTKFWY